MSMCADGSHEEADTAFVQSREKKRTSEGDAPEIGRVKPAQVAPESEGDGTL